MNILRYIGIVLLLPFLFIGTIFALIFLVSLAGILTLGDGLWDHPYGEGSYKSMARKYLGKF